MPVTTNDTEDRDALITTIEGFLNRIGIPCRQEQLPEGTFLPGIEIKDGGITYDPALMKYPGDLLHEAGHLAVLSPANRKLANAENINGDMDAGGAEMAAIAWSWAALIALKLDPGVVFHEQGYKGDAANLIDNFSNRRYLGHELLQWMGMTITRNQSPENDGYFYPKMKNWLRPEREVENEGV